MIRTISNTVRHVQAQNVTETSEFTDLEEQSIANIHVVKEKLGNKQMYSRQEFWRVVGELESMYGVNHLNAIDICMSEFMSMALNIEENGTSTNIAAFRIACWNDAENYNQRC